MKKLKSVAAGAVGGLMGAAVMGPVHAMAAKAMHQRAPRGEDATEKVAKAIVRSATSRGLRRSQRKTGGQIVHLAFGAGVGALYGLLASAFPVVTTRAGAAFGAAVYLGAHAVVTPALGLAPSPVENGFAQESVEFASHVVYGLVADSFRRVLG